MLWAFLRLTRFGGGVPTFLSFFLGSSLALRSFDAKLLVGNVGFVGVVVSQDSGQACA